MPPFIPGLKLAELFFHEAVQPIMATHFPGLAYSAARLDFGSDVLGFDTPQSRDHGWGPKGTLFVSENDYEPFREQIVKTLANELPLSVHGYPTHFTDEGLSSSMQAVDHGPVNHGVRVTTAARFFEGYVGFDPTAPIREVDWLAVPPQRLRTIASGNVFYDGLGQLAAARAALRWYPHDVWLYLLANQWRRVDQEEPFMARCGDVGDELGSRIVATRQIDELMRLCFLIERQYPTYYKWFGIAFSRLGCAPTLGPILTNVFEGGDWQAREASLSQAYLIVGEMHNALAITDHVEPDITPFFNRPYLVPHAGRFVEACWEAIRSKVVRSWPQHVGAVGQFVNSTDVLDSIAFCRRLGGLYDL
ncbi:MAG: DUF4037 domain-containing protein [Anaerolineae bacterium]|nr:DUF4037 domain-containing protein [Anaerolineae bacterium]